MNIGVCMANRSINEDELIDMFLREKRLVTINSGSSPKTAFCIYDNGRYIIVDESDVKNELKRYCLNYNVTPDFNLLLSKLRYKAPKKSVDDFFKKENGVYRIPGIKNDLLVNPLTGELKVVDKDPDNYPSLIALPYDFSKEPPSSMPEELREFLNITPPQFREALLFELVSPLTFERQLFVNYIVDNVGNALNTINEAFGALYGNYIAWRGFKGSGVTYEEDNAYSLHALCILAYEVGSSKRLTEFIRSPVLTARFRYGARFSYKNRFPVIVNVDNYENMPNHQLLGDAMIIPITDTIVGKNYPGDAVRIVTGIYWGDEVRENIVLWLIYNVLIRYLRGEHKKYIGLFHIQRLIDWENHKAPKFGLDEFVNHFIYSLSENSPWSVGMTLDEAYQIYLKWIYGKFMPLSFNQFKIAMGYYMEDGKIYLNKSEVAKLLTS